MEVVVECSGWEVRWCLNQADGWNVVAGAKPDVFFLAGIAWNGTGVTFTGLSIGRQRRTASLLISQCIVCSCHWMRSRKCHYAVYAFAAENAPVTNLC
jgi:hypothetical protein